MLREMTVMPCRAIAAGLLIGFLASWSFAVPPKLGPKDGLRPPVVKVGTADAAMVPLQGVAGSLPGEQFFTGASFESAIKPLKNSTIRRVVIVLDTTGGSNDTKSAIVREILSLRSEGIRTVAIVKNAAGVGALIALSCDEVLSLPGATFGGRDTLPSVDEPLRDAVARATAQP